MSLSRTVWLTRHGNREDFVNPLFPGPGDNPDDPKLSEDGIWQAELLAQFVKNENIQYLVCSPFYRTVQTASYVAEALDLPILIEPGVSEWYNPDWFSGPPKLLSSKELKNLFPRIQSEYSPLLQPEFSETQDELYERTARTIHLLLDFFKEEFLIIAHGISVAGLTRALVPEVPKTMYSLCGITKIVSSDRGWDLEIHNDTSHLGSYEIDPKYF